MKNKITNVITIFVVAAILTACVWLVGCDMNGNDENATTENTTSVEYSTPAAATEDTTTDAATDDDTTEGTTTEPGINEDDTYIYENAEYCAYTGRIVKTDKEIFLVTDSNSGPLFGRLDFTILRPMGDEVSLEGLDTGDRVKIYAYVVMESYPSQTPIPKLVFLEHGTVEDVPSDVLKRIEGFGYKIQ